MQDLYGKDEVGLPAAVRVGSIGGMIQIQKDWGEVPPHWLAYFQVEGSRSGTVTVVVPEESWPGKTRSHLGRAGSPKG